MKKIRRYLIAFIGIICLFTTLNAKAAYTYSHDNKIISAPAGYSATIDGVYNVLSTAWGGNINEKGRRGKQQLFVRIFTCRYIIEAYDIRDSINSDWRKLP